MIRPYTGYKDNLFPWDGKMMESCLGGKYLYNTKSNMIFL